MTDLTPENIARLRSVIDLAREQGLEDSGFILSERELTALLDAYEERDRLRSWIWKPYGDYTHEVFFLCRACNADHPDNPPDIGQRRLEHVFPCPLAPQAQP